MATDRLNLPQQQIEEFCKRHRIRRLALFGSAIRGDFRPESDVDLLVDFEPGTRIGYFGLSDLEDELSTMLKRKVDLRTSRSLSEYFRDQVLREARVLYAAA